MTDKLQPDEILQAVGEVVREIVREHKREVNALKEELGMTASIVAARLDAMDQRLDAHGIAPVPKPKVRAVT